MKYVFVFMLSLSFAWAGRPEAFSTLGAQLESERAQLEALAQMPQFDRQQVDAYAKAQQGCFEKGFALDAAVASQDSQRNALRSDYLSCLRALQKKSALWQHRYALALGKAIRDNEAKPFELLVTYPLDPLKRPSLKEQSLAYYETIRSEHNISAMEAMRDAASNTLYAEDEEAAAQDQPVFGVSEARKRKLPVFVSAKQLHDRYIFYAKNRNNFPVTVTLDLLKMKNFKASEKLPCHIELGPKAEEKLLDVDVVDLGKGSSMLPHYSWVMGRASARHSDPLYRLPFAVGTKALVSQGFNGGMTHNGRSCYAVDFSCAVGTKIYAARGGRVIAVETSHDRGGADKRFRRDANYIIIEHGDKTLGKYVHLKHNGATVRVGERVRTGQLIGYSGNTGYSTGPHLHFSVSSVDPDSKRVSVTLPFRFETAGGMIDTPKSREIYQVVKVQ
jgi:murein DD-endopeptidase MepM/ murein hydrolase activator NlpD